MVKEITKFINDLNIIVYVLFIGGIWFTIRFKAYNLRFGKIFSALRSSGEQGEKGISGVKALMLATASRIGNGNIAGVSSALLTGGPGALFWMWVTALLGMATAFSEGVLSQLFKKEEGDEYVGGTPFYIEKGLNWKPLAFAYAGVGVLTFGFAYMGVQSNTIAANFSSLVPGFDPFWTKLTVGAIIVLVFLAVAIGGIKSIANVANYVVPFMGTFYLIGALIVVILNIGKTGEVFAMIFSGAFSFRAGVGGVAGYTVMKAVQAGASRGVFSNEAGIGSASFAAGASNSRHPVQQGLLQSLSTFIDTILICTASGMIILYSGIWQSHDPAQSGTLIQKSLSISLGGGIAEWFVFLAVLMFGMTTIFGLFYYSQVSVRYFTNNKQVILGYTFVISSYLLYSSVAAINEIWDLADITTLLLVAMNVTAMVPLTGIVVRNVTDYISQVQANPGKTPEFTNPDNIKNADFWNKK